MKNFIVAGDSVNLFIPKAAAVLPVDHIISDPPYEMDMDALLRDLKRKIGPSGVVGLFSYPGDVPRGATEYQVWIKPESTKNLTKRCGKLIESFSIFRGPQSPFNYENLHWSQLTGVHTDRLVHKTIHPFQKPLALMQRLIRLYTNKGDTILDPFCGSGTTLLAAATLGRNFIGFENDPWRARAAVERIREKGFDCKFLSSGDFQELTKGAINVSA